MTQDLKWSPAEKKIARSAYDAALETTLETLVAEFKRKADAVTSASELWEIEDYLRQQRREIDTTFDYRYSQLLMVFAQLIRQGRLDESRLAGLSEDELEDIRRILSYFARD